MNTDIAEKTVRPPQSFLIILLAKNLHNKLLKPSVQYNLVKSLTENQTKNNHLSKWHKLLALFKLANTYTKNKAKNSLFHLHLNLKNKVMKVTSKFQ